LPTLEDLLQTSCVASERAKERVGESEGRSPSDKT
jgi:hypothetical protein